MKILFTLLFDFSANSTVEILLCKIQTNSRKEIEYYDTLYQTKSIYAGRQLFYL